jgi:hypothetical protein
LIQGLFFMEMEANMKSRFLILCAVYAVFLPTPVLPLYAQPNLDITLSPVNPPIVIPAPGGSFHFTVSIVNRGPEQVQIYLWTRIRYPNGQISPPGCYVQIDPPVGLIVSRLKNQNIPSLWHPGIYTYLGYASTSLAYPALDSSFFTFEKSVTSYEAVAHSKPSWMAESWAFEDSPTPKVIELKGIFPNPFNPTTAISFKLQAASLVSLKVYDTSGRLVATLVEGWREAGTHEVTFDGSKLASGMYLYALKTAGQTATGKILLLK